jgi:hypothetical protein
MDDELVTFTGIHHRGRFYSRRHRPRSSALRGVRGVVALIQSTGQVGLGRLGVYWLWSHGTQRQIGSQETNLLV